ncbi:NmrA family NAD(P)-binding protein [Streptomyces sp. NPDC014676]|uniref:NmrA family NAD(P)-binding protein n=1 Tax=Streptomyces sp. NPDC014676 TaxID=3364879 RepID=UPI0036F830FF
MSSRSAPVPVTGATGRQGGATARAPLAAGVPVHALVRDPANAQAQTIEAFGADLVNRRSPRPRFRHAGLDRRTREQMEPYHSAESRIQDRLREAGFPHWTLLKPGFFTDEFLPSTRFCFPCGIEGGPVSVVKPGTTMSLAAVEDIGTATAAAISAPERFDKAELELASDYLSMTRIAEILTRVPGVPLSAPGTTETEAIAAGMPPMGAAHELYDVVGQPARPQYARDLGLPLTGFEEWARRRMGSAA